MARLRTLFGAYPAQFWVLVMATFIDRLGGALLFPFLTLYITQKFGIGMTQVGGIFVVFSLSSVVGSFMGGALADRLGRKGMLLFGLIASGLTSLLMGFVDSLGLFMIVIMVVGLLANAGGPAQQAMVADLLPEEKRAEGFGILRVAVNLSFTIGPMLGGFLAAQSYLLLFVSDAVASMVTAVIVVLAIGETLPQPDEEAEPQTMLQSIGGYSVALRDVAFIGFMVASVLMVLVYMQMNTTLAVFLRDVHGVNEQRYGYLMSLNAAMVVLLQFPVTRWVGQYRPLKVMAAGTVLYAVGFALYGFVGVYVLFLLAMAVITVGEMMVSPVSQSIVARMAPETMRARYMAVYGFNWVIATAFGPLLAGLIMDNTDPRWVWYAAGLVGLVAAAGYYLLEVRAGRVAWDSADEKLRVLEQLEEGQISAIEANSLLDAVEESAWARLAPEVAESNQRYLRVRISDPLSGVMRSDLRLPVGLVNLALAAQSELGAELEQIDPLLLQELLDKGGEGAAQIGAEQRVEILLEDDDGPAMPE